MQDPLSPPQRGVLGLLRACCGQAALVLFAALLRRSLDAAPAAHDAVGAPTTADALPPLRPPPPPPPPRRRAGVGACALLARGARAADAAQQGTPLFMALHNVVAALAQATAPGSVVATPGLAQASWLFLGLRVAHCAGLLLLGAAGGLTPPAAEPGTVASARRPGGCLRALAFAIEALDAFSLALLALLWVLLGMQLSGLRWVIDLVVD